MDGVRAEAVLAGRYRLRCEWGGHGSAVWQAYDRVLERQVAMTLLAGVGDDLTARDRLRSRARLSASLVHPRVVKVFEYGEARRPDGSVLPFVVEEMAAGEPLAQRLADGPMPAELVLRVVREVADGLAEAHRAGAPHGDVSPRTVLVTGDGAKLRGFGQWAGGDPAAATAADVWSLGALVHGMLTGRPPGPSSPGEGARTPVVGVPPALDEVRQRCLADRPGDRPTAADVAEMLRVASSTDTSDDTPAEGGPVRAVGSAKVPTASSAAAAEPERAPSAGGPSGNAPPVTGPSDTVQLPAVAPESAPEPGPVRVTGPAGAARPQRRGALVAAVLVVAVLVGGVVTTSALTGPRAQVPGAAEQRSGQRGEALPQAPPPSERLVDTSASPTASPSRSSSPSPDPSPSPTVGPRSTPRVVQPTRTPEARTPACRVEWAVSSDQGGSFAATITVHSRQARQTWMLSFTFTSDQRIVRGWNAQFYQRGRGVTAQASNGGGHAGHEVSMGLVATYHGSNERPTGFSLSGTSCTVG